MEKITELINRTICNIAERRRISVDDVTDEMVMLHLAEIVVKNCSTPDVVRQSEQLNTDLENEVFNNNKDWATNDDIDGSFLYELKTIAYGKGSSSERLEEIKEKLSSK